ncbi:heparinase II/III family protein [Wenxinia saemankumensis]|uniref:Uncharacterized conserved protein, heparinase superfamily n=1 Tax=Wenxinia saemankumensis TaxID=1447782 RepID=A0A1M6EC05_9RHOB|nr:heparinase II/III family protein [Wenxinia saemankumensis]SHI82909.1 Uncharacterized conserved protein, heparinase superfamily [Wenxinia saemankumensis]
MARGERWAAHWARFLDRRAARRAVRRGRPAPLVGIPEPRLLGRVDQGRRMLEGRFLLGGAAIEAPGAAIWDVAAEEGPARDAAQGFLWLDDLAALGGEAARGRAQDWTFRWIDAAGRGRGPGWTVPLTARRVIRWIDHAPFLLQGRGAEDEARFFRLLVAQVHFLAQRWPAGPAGLPRIEALAAIVYAGLALQGQDGMAGPALAALAQESMRQVDAGGGLASRNPEDLLQVLTLLNRAVLAAAEADRAVPEPVTAAIHRIVPALRTLRHSDGALARFHGGGRGNEGRLDHALAAAGRRGARAEAAAMGFRRLSGGRTTLIVDAAPPPIGLASAEGHASTLAFELTSARRPLIVNCGSGRTFGRDWRRAGRATPSHSTLGIDGVSSARLAPEGTGNAAGWLAEGPGRVQAVSSDLGDGTRLELSHDGWRGSHGLTHARTLDLGSDGRALVGEDILTTLSDADAQRFDRVMQKTGMQGIAFSIRFHLHPDVEAELDTGGAAVLLHLVSGEDWLFQGEPGARLTLERSVYLESGRPRPRATQQVVLSGRTLAYATRMRWSLAKTHDTPDAVRDTAPMTTWDEDDA